MLKRPRLPTRREPRQARARETRVNILTAAARALRDEGAEVSMTRIADIAGYGIGTVYEYFPNRRSLICELMHQVCEDEFESVLALAPLLARASARELVGNVLEVLVASAAEHRVLMRVMFTEIGPTLTADEVEDLVPMFTAVLAEQLRARAEQTRVRDPDMAARFILIGVEAIITDAVLERPDWLGTPAFLEELTVLVDGYLSHARDTEHSSDAAPVESTG